LKQLARWRRRQLPLQFWFWRRQLAGSNGISESTGFVRAIAEGLVCGVPAAAEPDGRPAGQAKGFSFRIKDLEVSFHSDGSAVIDRNFRGRHFFSGRTESMPVLPRSDKHKCTPTPRAFCMNIKGKDLQKLHFVSH